MEEWWQAVLCRSERRWRVERRGALLVEPNRESVAVGGVDQVRRQWSREEVVAGMPKRRQGKRKERRKSKRERGGECSQLRHRRPGTHRGEGWFVPGCWVRERGERGGGSMKLGS